MCALLITIIVFVFGCSTESSNFKKFFPNSGTAMMDSAYDERSIIQQPPRTCPSNMKRDPSGVCRDVIGDMNGYTNRPNIGVTTSRPNTQGGGSSNTGLGGGSSNTGIGGGSIYNGLEGGSSNTGLGGGSNSNGLGGGSNNNGLGGVSMNNGLEGGSSNIGLGGGSSNNGLGGGSSNNGLEGGSSNSGLGSGNNENQHGTISQVGDSNRKPGVQNVQASYGSNPIGATNHNNQMKPYIQREVANNLMKTHGQETNNIKLAYKQEINNYPLLHSRQKHNIKNGKKLSSGKINPNFQFTLKNRESLIDYCLECKEVILK